MPVSIHASPTRRDWSNDSRVRNFALSSQISLAAHCGSTSAVNILSGDGISLAPAMFFGGHRSSTRPGTLAAISMYTTPSATIQRSGLVTRCELARDGMKSPLLMGSACYRRSRYTTNNCGRFSRRSRLFGRRVGPDRRASPEERSPIPSPEIVFRVRIPLAMGRQRVLNGRGILADRHSALRFRLTSRTVRKPSSPGISACGPAASSDDS